MNYKRVLLKLSGEGLSGESSDSDLISQNRLDFFCSYVKDILQDYQLSIVIGGGNILRGDSLNHIFRINADNMGMLATVINGIAFKDALYRHGVKAKLLSAIEMPKICEYYTQEKAVEYMKDGYVVIFVAGIANPFFTTDSAAIVRAIECNCDIIIKSTQVDGIYDKDPIKHSNSKRFDVVSIQKCISNELEVMDLNSLILARNANKNIIICKLDEDNTLLNVLSGKGIFSLIVSSEV